MDNFPRWAPGIAHGNSSRGEKFFAPTSNPPVEIDPFENGAPYPDENGKKKPKRAIRNQGSTINKSRSKFTLTARYITAGGHLSTHFGPFQVSIPIWIWMILTNDALFDAIGEDRLE